MRNADTVEEADRPRDAGSDDCLRKGQTVGRYVIDRRIGSGGMGVVYVAFDPELDRRVAIKLLRPDLVESTDVRHRRLRLVREAQAQARLSHQNVITVLDVGTHDDRVFVAMEYVDGWNMRQWLDERPRPWQQVLHAFIEAGRGLVGAHEAGLIHRDFKPQNVLIGRNREVRVTDFGLARAIDSEDVDPAASLSGEDALQVQLTQTGALLGTPYFMAPEQHAGADTDERTDQFSFCVSMWEALYGEHPYGGTTATEIARRIRDGELREPVRRWIPDWIYLDLARGLKADPAERYRSMAALLESLLRDRSAARRRVWGIALSVVGLAILGVVGYQRFATTPAASVTPAVVEAAHCDDATAGIDAIWNGGVRATTARAFADYDAAWTFAAGHLDDVAGEWKSRARSACADRDDRALRCLDRRAVEVAAVVDVLASATADTVHRSAHVLDAIGPLTDCGNEHAARGPLGPGEPEATRTAHSAIAHARARARAGYRDRAAIDRAVESAAQLGSDGLVAEARLARAELLFDTGALDDAERDVHAASTAALACDHVGAEVDAFTLLTRVSHARGNAATALRWATYAAAAEGRLGGGDLRSAHLSLARGRVLRDSGDRAGAREQFEAASTAYRHHLGRAHPFVALATYEHALTVDDPAAARALLEPLDAPYLPPALRTSIEQLVSSDQGE